MGGFVNGECKDSVNVFVFSKLAYHGLWPRLLPMVIRHPTKVNIHLRKEREQPSSTTSTVITPRPQVSVA
jgi:hypothetical protein